MEKIMTLSADLLNNGSWVPGILTLSDTGLNFYGKKVHIERAFHGIEDMLVEETYEKRQKLFRTNKELCMKLTIPGESYVFYITSKIEVEEVRQTICDYLFLKKKSKTTADQIQPKKEESGFKTVTATPETKGKKEIVGSLDSQVTDLDSTADPNIYKENVTDTVGTDQVTESRETTEEEPTGIPSFDQGEVTATIENEAIKGTFEAVSDASSNADIISCIENSTVGTRNDVSITYKEKFFRECKNFASACSEHIFEKRIALEEQCHSSYIFDIMNTVYITEAEEFQIHNMPQYIASNSRLVKCRQEGIYRTELYSAYDSFLPRTSAYQDVIIHNSIKDSITDSNASAADEQMICLMPDIVDDFSRLFRNQLNYNGCRLFQIPRSIALAFIAQPLESKDITSYPIEFLCLDYDGEELIAIKIRRETNDDGIPIFVRMGRFPLSGKHPSYRTLASEYISKFLKKNNTISLTQKMENDLVDTKLLQQMLLASDNSPVFLADSGLIACIWRDDEILREIQTIVLEDSQRISAQYSVAVYSLCCFGWPYQENLFGEDVLAAGCQAIRLRVMERKPLWEEYLPSLHLDVNQDGSFASLELIGEKDRHQQIESTYLGKVVEIKVENGTITLSAGKEYYDLPLEREVYGNMNKEKLARFQPEKPLEEDTEVELRVFYCYGDVDSYKLVAKTHDGMVIESYWCDTTELENPSPQYIPKIAPVSMSECQRIRSAFDEFAKNVTQQTAPFKISIYPGRSNHSYSRYLYGLNSRYWPFFPIQNYFGKENYSQVRDQIDDMLRIGIFGLVADVLNGVLPSGHNLEVESNPYAVGDLKTAASVLKHNMREVARLFGMLYTLHDNQGQGYHDIAEIVEAFRRSKSVEDWAPITEYVSRGSDVYGIWDSFRNALYRINTKRPDIYALRAISSVCYKSKEWIFEFYDCPSGRQDVEWLIKNINAVLDAREWADQKRLPYNPRKLRDVLELLLCICRLKNKDKTILDCNHKETKDLVKKLKIIDAELRLLQDQGQLTEKFDSRLGIDLPLEYRRVNKVIYSLIQTLTGGEVINLVGFKED